MNMSRCSFFGLSDAVVAAGFIPLKELPPDCPIGDGTEYAIHFLVDNLSSGTVANLNCQAAMMLQRKKVLPATVKKYVVQRVDLVGNPYAVMFYGRTV